MPIRHGRRTKRYAASALSTVGALALLLALLGSGGARALAQDDGEEPEPITVELVGSGIPSTVEGQELALRKVTFQPGAVLPAHSHPGALVLTVVAGELGYTLLEGEASIQRAPVDGEPGSVEPLVIGEEAILVVGDSLFEENVLHEARNPGDEPTIVWVSSLLTEGEPFVHLEEAAEGEEEATEEATEEAVDGSEEATEEAADESEEESTEGAVSVRLDEFEIRMPEELPAGETTFEIENTGSVGHSFAISGGGVEAALDAQVAPGQTATLTVDLAPGEYLVICPVANHEDLGMTRTLTVVEAEDGAAEDGEDGEADEEADEEAATPEPVTVSILDFAFEPATIDIVPGTTVTWVNDGQAPHTVTSDDGAFDSGTIEPGASFSFTFEEAGTFAYHCDIHPSMTATVNVAEAAPEDGTTDGGEGAAVDIVDFTFQPPTVEIAAGSTVTWTHSDGAPHTVTSDDEGTFDSGRLVEGDTFEFTFDEAGTFAYHCDIHPRMTGTVEVS